MNEIIENFKKLKKESFLFICSLKRSSGKNKKELLKKGYGL